MAKRIFLKNNRSNNPNDAADILSDKVNNQLGLRLLEELSRKPKSEGYVASKRNIEHNRTARRMNNDDKNKLVLPDGSIGNVYVSSYDNYVVPGIRYNDKDILEFTNKPIIDNQAIYFEDPQDAIGFGENYKQFAPMMNENWIDIYKDGGLIENLFAQLFKHGGIYIKPENRGKFTATMKRTGKTAEELSHSKNPVTRKRAIFCLNARKWHHK